MNMELKDFVARDVGIVSLVNRFTRTSEEMSKIVNNIARAHPHDLSLVQVELLNRQLDGFLDLLKDFRIKTFKAVENENG